MGDNRRSTGDTRGMIHTQHLHLSNRFVQSPRNEEEADAREVLTGIARRERAAWLEFVAAHLVPDRLYRLATHEAQEVLQPQFAGIYQAGYGLR